ncbi:MAG: CrcB family protein [Longimonas sp.]|uniref:fluoride efflux transporter FluC n=1 Tax=Longimonas sp. TaxID=2039626 RepID=UPI0033479744
MRKHIFVGLAVMAGGAVGGGLRYALILLAPYEPGDIPWIIFAENIAGAFLLGWIGRWLMHAHPRHIYFRLFLTTGLLGSFTTFSTYALDLVYLVESGRSLVALGYASASMILGLLAALAGLVAADRRYAFSASPSNP